MRKKLKCPLCGSDDISLVTSKKKGLNIFLILLVCTIGVVVVIALLLNGQIMASIIALVVFSAILTILKAIQFKRREELHTKAICHECSHKWFID